MKNAVILLLAAATLGAAGFAVYQHNQLSTARSRLAARDAELADLTSQLNAAEGRLAAAASAAEKVSLAERKAKLLQDTLSQSTAAAQEHLQQVADLQKSLAEAQTNSGSLLTELFKDPDMREMIKVQQKTVIGPLVDKTYGPLFKQLKLEGDQSSQLKKLIEEKLLGSADIGMSMLDGSMDSVKRTDLGKKIKEASDAIDAQIKELVGTENYSLIENYEKSLPDRTVVSQFQDQLTATSSALEPAVEQQLIDLMQEERTRFQWTTDYSANPDTAQVDLAAYFQEDRLDRYLSEKERFDGQYLQRVQPLLKEDQYTALAQFLESQRKVQLAAMKMAAKMLGGGTSSDSVGR